MTELRIELVDVMDVQLVSLLIAYANWFHPFPEIPVSFATENFHSAVDSTSGSVSLEKALSSGRVSVESYDLHL